MCPAGKRALSGGGAVSVSELAALSRSQPMLDGSGNPTGWTVEAYRTTGLAIANWTLTVYAVCAVVQ
jgi:hypothetical protein